MNDGANRAADSIQERIKSYACGLDYDRLSPETIHAAKVRVIDTLGALIAGFFGEPCRIARKLAGQMPNPDGATVIGTRTKATVDMAAFANATTARYMELNDTYNPPGSFFGHPSDVLTPLLATAEFTKTSGREFITSVVLAYEIYLRINDVFHNMGFDQANHCCLATAVGAGKLLALSADQLSHCIAMAVVPNVVLRQAKTGQLSMFKAAVYGQAGRAGVFAALLARAGMEGPHLPFEGKAGWCNHVARERFSLDVMGGNGTPFKILDTSIKLRPSVGLGISSILAAEKVSPLRNIADVRHVTVEVHKMAKERVGTGELRWNPESRESADHSIPYLVATTLIDGTVTPSSFDDAHLSNPNLRALMQKIEVVENQEFTQAYDSRPVKHCARVTVVCGTGERLAGEFGNNTNEPSTSVTDAQIVEKFRRLTEDSLGAPRVSTILDRLWRLEELDNVAEIPPAFVLA